MNSEHGYSVKGVPLCQNKVTLRDEKLIFYIVVNETTSYGLLLYGTDCVGRGILGRKVIIVL